MSPPAEKRAARRGTRFWLGLIVFLGLMGTAFALAREFQDQGAWARVERRDLVIGVELEGELEAVESVQLGPPQINQVWNFKIAWMIPEGSEVVAGTPLLRFDTNELDERLRQKITERDAAEKNLEKRQTDFEVEGRELELRLAEAEARLRRARLKLDVPSGVESRHAFELARIDERLAELESDSLKSNLEHLEVRSKAEVTALAEKRDRAGARVAELERDIERMTLTAPRGGTVIYVADWRGDKKKVGDSVWRAGKVLEIPDLERMRARGQIAEADIGRVEVGQPVDFTLDAYPDRQYSGRVRMIRNRVRRKSATQAKKVVDLEIELEATDRERMRPGMRLRGTIETERAENLLVVPESAVFPLPEGAAVRVRTLLGERQVEPVFGPRNEVEFGVLEGLEEGTWVKLRGGE